MPTAVGTEVGTAVGKALGSDAEVYTSPAVSLAADNAWSAANVTATTTTSAWLPVRGSVSLATLGVAQPAPAAVASLGGRLAVTWNTATGAYQGTIPDPTVNQTLMFVGRIGAGNGGWLSITNGGALNTGSSMFWDGTGGGTVFGRRLSTDVTKLYAASTPVVAIAALTAAGADLYVNSYTPVSVASAAAAFNKTVFTLGALNTALLYAMNGHSCAEAAVWARALSAAEIYAALTAAGRHYSVSIAA